MNDSHHVDETDRALLHGLQMAPRATWAQLADVVGISESTAARRWDRLVGSGTAWTTGYTAGGTSSGALVEIDCEPGTTGATADLISADPRAITVDFTSGGRDLLVTVLTGTFGDLSECLLGFAQVPGVRAVRGRVTTRIVSDASRWRLDALSAEQQTALRNRDHASTRPLPGRQPDELARCLVTALSQDGRMSATDLAQRFSVSVNTVRRRLEQLTANRWLRVRCDVIRAATGHAAVTCWLRVPPAEVLHAANAIATLPQARLVATVTGPENLVVMAWLSSAADIPGFEANLVCLAPAAGIEDRAITLRTAKHLGRILDETGHVVDLVPLDIWPAKT